VFRLLPDAADADVPRAIARRSLLQPAAAGHPAITPCQTTVGRQVRDPHSAAPRRTTLGFTAMRFTDDRVAKIGGL